MMSLTHQKDGSCMGKSTRAQFCALVQNLPITEYTVTILVYMEPAWVKVCKSNFRLTSRTIVQPNGGTREVPCYQLTKTECLYIATKFNDEARAKLVLRDMGIQ